MLHTMAHTSYNGQILYFASLGGWVKRTLKRKCLEHTPNDLEGGKCELHWQAQLETTGALVCRAFQVAPPTEFDPGCLDADVMLQRSATNAGGRVSMSWLVTHGLPMCALKQNVRSKQQFAPTAHRTVPRFNLHCFRATHKVNYSFLISVREMQHACAIPELEAGELIALLGHNLVHGELISALPVCQPLPCCAVLSDACQSVAMTDGTRRMAAGDKVVEDKNKIDAKHTQTHMVLSYLILSDRI
jgi:hypothetical protein